LGEIISKASTIQKSGKAIEETAQDMKKDLEEKVNTILEMLRAKDENN
jgi:hypothetical protein